MQVGTVGSNPVSDSLNFLNIKFLFVQFECFNYTLNTFYLVLLISDVCNTVGICYRSVIYTVKQ